MKGSFLRSHLAQCQELFLLMGLISWHLTLEQYRLNCTGPTYMQVFGFFFDKYILQFYVIQHWLNAWFQNLRYRGLTEIICGFSNTQGSAPLTPMLFRGQLFFFVLYTLICILGNMHPGLIDSTWGILLTYVASEEASLILVPPVFLKWPGNFSPQMPVNVLRT